MKYSKICLLILFGLIISANIYAQVKNDDSTISRRVRDSVYTQLLINHLRQNFDDIHDVSMRFHHKDHNLNGVIQISMLWENEKMQKGEVIWNETKDESFGKELVEKIKDWKITGLEGPFEIILPLRIRIVGLDDPTFSQKSIVTGIINDNNNKPLHRAKVIFISEQGDTTDFAHSSREGIFVRTLINPGKYRLEFSMEGYETKILPEVILGIGEHRRELVELKLKSLTE